VQLSINPLTWIIVFYVSTTLQPSLWSDDYPALTNPKEFSLSLVSDLRPLWALLHSLYIFIFGTSTFAWLPKVLAAFFLILSYRTAVFMLSKNDEYIIKSTFAACLFLPSISIFVHWSTFWQNSLAFFLGIYSLKLSAFLTSSVKNYLFAFLCFSTSVMIYPPSAFASFGILAISVLLRHRYETYIPKSRIFLLITFVSGAASFLIANAVRVSLGVEAAERVEFLSIQELPEKLFYLSKLILISFNIFSTARPSDPIHTAFSFFCVISFLSLLFSNSSAAIKARLIVFGKSVILILFSLCPVLVTRDNQIELRFLAGLTMFVTFFTILGVINVVSVLTQKLKFLGRSTLAPLSFIVLLVAGTTSVDRYSSFFEYNYKRNLSFVQTSLNACNLSMKQKILIVKVNPPNFSERLGIYSMPSDFVSDWVPLNATRILDERLRHLELQLVERSYSRISDDSCVLDMGNLYKMSKMNGFW